MANHGIGPNTVSTFHRTAMMIEIRWTTNTKLSLVNTSGSLAEESSHRHSAIWNLIPVKFSVRWAPWFPGPDHARSLRSDAWTLFLLAYMCPLGLVLAIFPVFGMVFVFVETVQAYGVRSTSIFWMGISVGSIVMSRLSDKVCSRAFQMPVAVALCDWLVVWRYGGWLQAWILSGGCPRIRGFKGVRTHYGTM